MSTGGGWYLYGITRHGPPELVPVDAEANVAPLEVIEVCGLAAVVRPVLPDEFSPAVLQERLRDEIGRASCRERVYHPV